jgi:membrane protease YdiL (CAAX protease family)
MHTVVEVIPFSNKGGLTGDLALVLLPWPLFLVPFRLASENVILSMALVSTILALTAITFNRTLLELLTLNVRVLIAGLISAIALYLVFLLGHILASSIGLGQQVNLVYSIINVGYLELALIPVIGFMEEAYWRGYLQETLVVRKLRVNWALSTIPYALVHVTSGLAILVLAAWVVGLVLGFTARTQGLSASIIAHVLWLYLVLYVLPTYRIL